MSEKVSELLLDRQVLIDVNVNANVNDVMADSAANASLKTKNCDSFSIIISFFFRKQRKPKTKKNMFILRCLLFFCWKTIEKKQKKQKS